MVLYFKICSPCPCQLLSTKWPKMWESQKEIIMLLICCLLWIYPSGKKKKKKLGRGTLFPIFSEGSEGGVCTRQATHRFYKTFWTSIRALRIQLQKNYSSTFLLFEKLYKVESVIAIKTNYNFILIIETFSTAIKIHLNCFLVRWPSSYVICQVTKR